ncbi:hypothetical protein FE263_03965 [Lichenicoccus roseus]|uniref:Uncharacterized protein n=2 Tax=Lichenicoccus roseus TaxID=2683649 RepID=A0A5R9J9S3_9PROT|nr:hypothetical protein FE263_03965 [Lichenicoccus roseus]
MKQGWPPYAWLYDFLPVMAMLAFNIYVPSNADTVDVVHAAESFPSGVKRIMLTAQSGSRLQSPLMVWCRNTL